METIDGRLFSFGASIECITKSVEDSNCTEDSIIKKVETVNGVLCSSWMTSLSKLNNQMSNEDRIKVSLFCRQLEEIVIGLWNTTVAHHNSKKLHERTSVLLRQLCFDLIASSLFFIIKQGSPADPANNLYYHRKIQMGIKSAKGWIDVKDFKKAHTVLQQSSNDVNALLEAIFKSGKVSDDDSEVAGLKKNQVSILCYLLETMYRLEEYGKMREVLDSFKDLDSTDISDSEQPSENGKKALATKSRGAKLTERERECVICITYNLGLEAANGKIFEQAEVLLKFSFEFRKDDSKNATQTSQTLRLLAHVYWEKEGEDNLAKALETAKLGIQYHKHPAGYHLILRIMCEMTGSSDDEIKEVLKDLLSHPNLDINHGLSACRRLNSRKKYDVCEFGIAQLLSRFKGSRHMGRVHILRLHTSIDRLPHNERTSFAENFLSDVDIISEIDKESEKQLHLLLWEQAAKSHEQDDLENCLAWYDRSLAVYLRSKSLDELKTDQSARDNVAKLYRNKSSCYVDLSRLDEAENAANMALKLDETNLFSNFTRLKVLIAQEKQAEAVETIDTIINKCDNLPIMGNEKKDESSSSNETGEDDLGSKLGLVCLAAQLAFERNQRDVAMTALRHLVAAHVHRVAKLTAHRCLIRLYLTIAEELSGDKSTSKKRKLDGEDDGGEGDVVVTASPGTHQRRQLFQKAIDGVSDAFEILKSIKSGAADVISSSDDDASSKPASPRKLDDEKMRDEVMWFMKVAWNIALEMEEDYSTMRRLFLLCKDLLDLLDKNEAVLLRMKTCLLMSAASGLALAREHCNSGDGVKDFFESVLSDVKQCYAVCEMLEQARLHKNGSGQQQTHDKSSVLLALYELEATAKLSGSSHPHDTISPQLDAIFQRITRMPVADLKTFETVAALAMERPARHPELSKSALKVIVHRLNKLISETDDHQQKIEMIKRRSTNYRFLIDLSMKHGSSLDPVSQNQSWIFANEVYCFLQQDSIKHPETDTLWLSVKCWNVGIGFYVAEHFVDAEKWCSLAIRFLAYAERYREGYEKHMNTIYQDILAKKDSTAF